jgi:hypothetical protein
LADSYEYRDIEIVQHYYKHLGKETRALLFDTLPAPSPNPIFVMEYAPPSDEYDWVYTTVGASRKIQKLEISDKTLMHRTEFIMFANKQNDEIVDTLLTLAAYPFIYETTFNVGDLVAGTPGEGIVTSSPLTEILLTHTYSNPPEFETIIHADGDTSHILWVIPIYLSERTYAREQGYLELERLFGIQQTDTSDLWRKPVI